MKIFKKIFFCALIPRIHFRIEFLTARKFLFSLFSFFFEIQNSTISNSNDRSSWTRCSVRSKSNCLRRVIRRGGGRNRSTNNRNEIFFANAPSSCDSPRRDGLSRIKKPSHVPVTRGITLEFTLEERFVSRWTRRSRAIYRRTGFIGSKFNGYLVPIPIQCAPWSNEGFPLWWWENVLRILSTIPNRGKEKSREEKGGSAINRISGCKIDLCAVSCVFIRRVVTRGFLSTFISRYINVSGRNYTPSRAAHSLIHSAIIIALPPSSLHSSLCAKPRQARVINFVINHRELRVFVHVLLDAWCARRFCPPQLFEWRECRRSNIIESINFTAISDSQYRRFHLPRLFAFHHYDSLIFGSNVVELT